MKKTLIQALFCLVTLMCGACTGQSKDDGGKDTPKEFIPTSWNGEFLKAISDAYETFSETDEMPVSVNVEGITYSQAKYFSAACGILDLIEAYPDTWQERPDVEIPKYSAGGVMQWNTFEQDEISLDAVKWMIWRMREYASGKGMYPNYCSFGTRTWKDDRSGDSTVELNYKSDKEEYVGNIVFRQALVVMSRIMNHYKNNLMLPEKTSSWWSGFLGSTSNCPVDDPLVLSTMKEAISGKVTAREKAEAIFTYARDNWTWEDYYNTKKGAVGTINAKGGNCCDMAHAIIAMSRAAGLPARYIHGQCYFSKSVIGHVIPEIFVDGEWFICDATNKNSAFGRPVWKGMQTFNGLYNELPF